MTYQSADSHCGQRELRSCSSRPLHALQKPPLYFAPCMPHKIQKLLPKESHSRRSKLCIPTMRQRRRNVEARQYCVREAPARCVQETRRGKKTLNRERDKKDKIGGLTSGDWGGLGSYLWELTLERGNFAKRRRERATHYRLCGQPS